METIESKIKGERYNTEEELISDFKLMFHNCQRYNEEGSVIHTDATTLERVRPGMSVLRGDLWVMGGEACRCTGAGRVQSGILISKFLKGLF